MENATDALKIAFAVLVFTLALGVSMLMFTKLNEVSSFVISSTDSTQYYEYETADATKKSRIVGIETIIPTLYKYYKENYTVIFLDKGNKGPLGLYNCAVQTSSWGNRLNGSTDDDGIGTIGKYYTNNKAQYESNDRKPVCSFDVDEEKLRHEPWVGKPEDFKANLDAFLSGGKFYYPSDPSKVAYNYANQYGGFIERCKKYNYKFEEMLGEYTYNVESSSGTSGLDNALLKNRKKRVIVYKLVS